MTTMASIAIGAGVAGTLDLADNEFLSRAPGPSCLTKHFISEWLALGAILIVSGLFSYFASGRTCSPRILRIRFIEATDGSWPVPGTK
jgi:hypothetical protein